MEENQKIISAEELVARAKKLGVDFGNGDPNNRLRYYTKIELIPHAIRKSFNGEPPAAAYSESVIDMLVEIDRELKAGRSIQELKRFKKQNGKIAQEENIFYSQDYQFKNNLPIYNISYDGSSGREDSFKKSNVSETKGEEFSKDQSFVIKSKGFKIESQTEKEDLIFSETIKNFLKTSGVSIAITALSFIIFAVIITSIEGSKNKNIFSNLSASFGKIVSSIFNSEKRDLRVAQQSPADSQKTIFPEDQDQKSLFFEGANYLTINAETYINSSLDVKEGIKTPSLNLSKNDFGAVLTAPDISAQRTYAFPNQSGIVCLSSGNCIGAAGEVITPGGALNRLAKFISQNRIGNASIEDLYSGGVALTIDSVGKIKAFGDFSTPNLFVSGQPGGNVGIGMEDPKHTLHVKGKIQATGDVCTDMSGGKCLSELTTQIPMFFAAAAAGIRGTGSASYIPLWTANSTLGNSVIFQDSSQIGINTSSPNETLTISGVFSMAEIADPSATADFGKVYVGTDNKLYYMDEGGIKYDLTSGGIGGSGISGQIAFWDSASSISGDNDFVWDNSTKNLGIGVAIPAEKLDVAGIIKTTGFQLTTGANAGWALISDASGVGTWQSLPAGTMPPGSNNQTIRHDGSNWVGTSFLWNTGLAIGIGTSSPSSTLSVAGDMSLTGPISLTTVTSPQLSLKYDLNNYLNFVISGTQSGITASKTLIIDSLTGTIQTGSNTTLLDASLATVQGATFISNASDSTVRKSGEMVFRGAAPIFRYVIPSQSTSTSYIRVSKYFDNALTVFPAALPGGVRKYAFLINSADDIATGLNSEWRIYRPGAGVEYSTFNLPGLQMASLTEGLARMSGYQDLPVDDWQLEVRVPATKTIRAFNILLLAYDQIN